MSYLILSVPHSQNIVNSKNPGDASPSKKRKREDDIDAHETPCSKKRKKLSIETSKLKTPKPKTPSELDSFSLPALMSQLMSTSKNHGKSARTEVRLVSSILLSIIRNRCLRHLALPWLRQIDLCPSSSTLQTTMTTPMRTTTAVWMLKGQLSMFPYGLTLPTTKRKTFQGPNPQALHLIHLSPGHAMMT